MNDQYAEIRAELQLTKKELESRLSEIHQYEMASEFIFTSSKSLQSKQKFMFQTIKDDLSDVNRALLKMELNLFGICEDTGQQIPIEKLKIIPTARSIHDFAFHDLFKDEVTFI